MQYPATISSRQRFLWGALGLGLVLLVWWAVTWPVFSETVTRRVAETQPDGRVTYRDVTETKPRALVNPPALETPWRTFQRAGEVGLLDHIGASAWRILLGFLLSVVIAVPLGVAMGLYPRMRATLNPIISLLRPLPSISWVPLAVIWFGVDETQKIAIIFMGSFAAALIYTIEATLRVPPDLVRAALNLGLRRRQLLTRVLLPAALPSILSGLKVVLAICWTCVISAEIVGTKLGLGSLIWNAKEINDTAAVLVGMVCISGVVLILDLGFSLGERTLMPHVRLDGGGHTA